MITYDTHNPIFTCITPNQEVCGVGGVCSSKERGWSSQCVVSGQSTVCSEEGGEQSILRELYLRVM